MIHHRVLVVGLCFLAFCAREGRPWRAAARHVHLSKLKMTQGGGSPSGHMLLSGLAATGAVETGYLTLQKLTDSPISSALCNSGTELDSCNTVLSGPFSVIPVVNFPLAGAAFVVYSAIAVLSLLSLQEQQGIADSDGGSSSTNNNNSILFLSTTMATFSAYLVALLRLVLQTSCNYCYLSAAISFALAAVAWTQGIVPNKTRAFVVTASSMALTTVTSAFLFYTTSVLSLGVPPAQASTAPAAQYLQQEEARSAKVDKAEAPSPPPVTSASSPEALAVASRLQKLDAKMYGAYWCSHCFNQKQALGVEAKAKFAYIECDKEGKNSQYDMCKSKKIPGYPTWEIQGNYYPGEKSVTELGALLSKIEAAAAEAGAGQR